MNKSLDNLQFPYLQKKNYTDDMGLLPSNYEKKKKITKAVLAKLPSWITSNVKFYLLEGTI